VDQNKFDNKGELRHALEQRLGPLSEKIWEQVCPGWSPPYDEADLDEITEKAVELLASSGEAYKTRSLDWLKERAKRLIDELDLNRKIETFREEVFGSSQPPFETPADADAWIGKRSEEELTLCAESEIIEIPWLPLDRVSWVDKSSGTFGPISGCRGGALERLKDLCEELTEGIGYDDSREMAIFILTGNYPIIPPISVKWDVTSKSKFARSFSITVRAPWITNNALLEIIKRLKALLWDAQRALKLSDRDKRLIEHYYSTLGLTWEERHRRWNDKYPGTAAINKNLDTFRIACQRALKKLSGREETEELWP